MVIDILDTAQPQGTPATAFLKLLDRRFSHQLRQDNGIDPWTKDMEDGYRKLVDSGEISTFLHDLHKVENYKEDTSEDWDDAQNEAFLAYELLRLYRTEVQHFPRSTWQGIVDQAVSNVRLLGDHNILNRDVRPENFVVAATSESPGNGAQVFMINFALCRFRGPEESDLEWGRAKFTKDEEGAVGLSMRKWLGEHCFELK